ncbi:ATP-binding protein [Limibacter armeniacum]|uniref:AlbA family DNA-binding domain-containing protein n=1 Tax=Limibacter armeniacum TaxID=466084 RepID=UPI002FE64A81
MELSELRRLVNSGEGTHIEFKKKVADPLKITKEVVAFANATGGYLIVGVSDDGKIDGVREPEGELYILEEEIRKRCKPSVHYTVHKVPLNRNIHVLVLEIKESTQKPVFLAYNLKTGRGKAYIRVADKSVQMSKVVRNILKESRRELIQGFSYGVNEQWVLRYLDEHERVTLKEFSEKAKISQEDAEAVLVSLTVSNVLEVLPSEVQDIFRLKPNA